jgi:hypothetical protein
MTCFERERPLDKLPLSLAINVWTKTYRGDNKSELGNVMQHVRRERTVRSSSGSEQSHGNEKEWEEAHNE